MYKNFFKYPGNKKRFLPTVIPIIKSSIANTYIEPFFGSGVIFLNSDNFKRYVINDIQGWVFDIYKTLAEIEYSVVQEFYYDIIIKKFGNIGKDKNSYYNFRTYVNNLEPGHYKNLGLFYLTRSCINSMARFGPGGFNQGFGNRGRDIFFSVDDLEFIKQKFNKVEMFNSDYKELKSFNSSDSLWILDPPYNDAPIDTYHNKFSFKEFKEFVSTLKGDIIYFDTENEFGDTLFNNKIILRTMNSISPKTKHSTNKLEVCYHNINVKNTLF